MGLLDDAIRQHLDLKRRHGADPGDVAKLEHEAFGPVERDDALAVPALDGEPPGDEDEAETSWDESQLEPESPGGSVRLDAAGNSGPSPSDTPQLDPEDGVEREGHDELEETPEFLQETPEHDRMWFEQKPPRDFDF